MTPPKLTARRLLGAGALFAGLGVFGAAFAAPAGADALVWGTAQARVAGGDLLAGHATATSFGDDIEDTAATGVLLGPLADYAVVTGEAGASVDADGAHATTTLDSATVRLGAADLVDLGLVEAPEGWSPVSTAADPDGNADDGSDTTGEPEATAFPAPEATPTAADPTAGPSDTPSGLPDGARSGDGTAPDMGSPTAGAEPSASPSTSGDGAVRLDETDSDPLSGTADTVGFSLSDVVSTASAGFDGRTEASLEYGNLTASGVELEGVEDTENGYVVDDSVAFLDADGSVIEEVGVSVGIAINEATFEDGDEGWDGRGVRSWLTVWVQVGEADEEDGDRLVVDFAETRVLGSTHDPAASPTPDPTPDPTSSATPTPSPKPTPTEDPSDRRLATTGGSLAALVVAAVVAVGGGTTATFLARKRTTAMDDRIGD
ncbi:hypothetical protein KIK06_20095 [Nocardiopsis sp. EMB25]|uniref:hypothetical protein n=1 Tax=Nocardiopsis sp. EMB25 TaxID=2835867 RepID=UPI002284AED1|nr:hypothetical protein [Nocardiopsis sp. EMB25]MCY9786199.1 hypothetical protein [Nocardiopsis sp. EMB25]